MYGLGDFRIRRLRVRELGIKVFRYLGIYGFGNLWIRDF